MAQTSDANSLARNIGLHATSRRLSGRKFFLDENVTVKAALATVLIGVLLVGGGPDGPPQAISSVVAFPGAEGFGAQSLGGRGGRVIRVTNLNDSGPGSLRAAATASGPRTVVFRTGGTITLGKTIKISNPNITIAGQTAPGGGITLTNHPSNTKSSLHIRTHDVVLRYIRVRPGPSSSSSDVLRGIGISEDAHDVIVDHCSISWGVDTNLTTWDTAHDITVQWSIVSEALNNSVHPEGPHSKGFGIGGDGGSYNISVHHNLFAHNDHRNPQVSNDGSVDLVNNVIYNYGTKAISSSDIDDRVELNVVGNYVKPGPDSNVGRHGLELKSYTGLGFRVFASGNISPQRPTLGDPNAEFLAPADRSYLVPTPAFAAPSTRTTSAFQAYQEVLAGAGTTIPMRDSVDARVINEVVHGGGRIIDHPSQVGGWPYLARGIPPRDLDRDGMPNKWERFRGLNPRRRNGGRDRNGDGYTNIEEYINGLVTAP
jgi:pectate lyase